MKKLALSFFLLILIFPLITKAATLKNTYPRLLNYFLKWEINDQEAAELSKWDVIVLDMEVAENSKNQLLKIRKLNPNIVILAYITSQEIIQNINDYDKAYLRQRFNRGIIDAWYLHDQLGQKISNWPETAMFNVSSGAGKNSQGQRFNDYLPEFVAAEIAGSGLWDGVFYDNIWGDVAWINNGNLDLNNDRIKDGITEANTAWSEGVKKILTRTKELTGHKFIIVGNGRVYYGYKNLLNGMMLENFPSAWENGGTWAGSIETYFKMPENSLSPALPLINTYDKNKKNYQHFRFGLTSALLGEGYYSFDYDVTSHGQTWWYDEYNINLGPAYSKAYNLLGNNKTELKNGLWRRDFKYGSVIVNSTGQEQTPLFLKENLEKIKGEQDPLINNGLRINYLKLAPQDGIVLLKRNTLISNSPFTNGYFFRIYDYLGSQQRSGFFSYLSSFPGSDEIVTNSTNDDSELTVSAGLGKINLTKNGKQIFSFYAYDKAFKNALNLATDFKNSAYNLAVVGPRDNGGPQVRLFTLNGKLKNSFFAYDQKLRSGVNVALADVNGDGALEIITGPGKGNEPLIKIFSLSGVLKNSFLAYAKDFKGGVNVATGDVDNDGRSEIITAPGQGGGPQIRIFDYRGNLKKSFFAYDASYHGGVRISISDINEDGTLEILTGIKNLY
ncbi:MAG: putative glycoside hydrolase [Patescibacteria group bacterium]